MGQDMEHWSVLSLLPSTGLVGRGRLVLLRGELSFNLVDERHWWEWLDLSVPVSRAAFEGQDTSSAPQTIPYVPDLGLRLRA